MDDAQERRSFAAPPAEGTVGGLKLELLDPGDPDGRRFLIQAEHPELRRALRDELDEITLAGQVMSPRLHITMHEVVATQLWDDDPPEAWETAKRLLADAMTAMRCCTCWRPYSAVPSTERFVRAGPTTRRATEPPWTPFRPRGKPMRDEPQAPHANRAKRRAARHRRHR